MNDKETAIKLIESLPEDVTLEDIMYRLYVRQRIERGLGESDRGETITHESLKQSVIDWIRFSGP